MATRNEYEKVAPNQVRPGNTQETRDGHQLDSDARAEGSRSDNKMK